MKRILLYLIIIILMQIQNNKIISEVVYKENFINIAEDFITKKKYFKLKRICNIELKKNPDYYIAAYYKAYSMQKLGKANVLKYYLEYIQAYPDMPNNYKEKWLDIALEIYKKDKLRFGKNKVKFSKSRIEINIQSSVDEFYTEPKILHDAENIYYLAQNGELFLIKKVIKSVTKINYYKTRDLALFDNYIVFNDSINLIKYNLRKDIHEVVYTFEKDNISFISTSPLIQQGVLKHQESDNYLIKQIDFNNKVIKELPDNCIAQSDKYFYLVMDYEEKFEVLNSKGEKLLTIYGDFISFGTSESEIYYYMDNYLYFMDISTGIKKQIIYIPEYNYFIGFKIISYNKILFSFDQNIIEYRINKNKVNFTKGKLLHIFRTGYMFTDNKNIYFYSLLNNSVKLLFDDINILDNIIFPGNDSLFFIIREGRSLIINNLR